MELNQFIRVESYGRSSPKKAKSGFCQNINDVINEANRVPGNFPHVDNPSPPVLLHGRPLDEIAGVCEGWAGSMKDAKGRALRKDALCLLAGVITAPEGMEDWPAFRDESVKWLKKKYGDSLECVVEHVDEDNPHIHFYVVPRPGQRFETVHEGRAASDAITGTKMRASKQVAYDAAMTMFQDRFHADVSSRFDFARIGPGAPRVSRAEAVKRKETRKAVEATMMREVKSAIDEGLVQGRRKGFKQGVSAGKADFEGKSLYAKLAGFVAGLQKKNKELASDLAKAVREGLTMRERFDDLKSKAAGYVDELKNLRPEVKSLRSKNAELEKNSDQHKIILADFESVKTELSMTKGRVRYLDFTLDRYIADEQKRVDEERAIRKVLKVKEKTEINSLDYS
jgi:hypothetical protein